MSLKPVEGRGKIVKLILGRPCHLILTCMTGLFLADAGFSAGKSREADRKDRKVDDVESILERLEKKLTDSETGGLTFDERMKPATGDSSIPKSEKTMKFERDGSSEPGGSKLSDDAGDSGAMLRELSDAVASLETKVERLHSDIQKARLKVIEDARVDNFVQIEAEFRGLDRATVRSLIVSMDGIEIYRASESGGLWMPSSKLPLYAGPVPPGVHKLSVDASLLVRENLQVPVSSDVTRQIVREFEFSIPDGKDRRQMTVTVEAPIKADSKGNISLSGTGEVKL